MRMDHQREPAILIFRVRRARQKAIKAAIAEALSLLSDLHPMRLAGGPLGDQPGIFWLQLNQTDLPVVTARLPLLGYSVAVEIVRFYEPNMKPKRRRPGSQRTWHGRSFGLELLYNEDSDEFREQAPDKRIFLLQTESGPLKEVRGYRGDSRQLNRRGLPVSDARLLANLALVRDGGRFLDPFAGAGGIVLAALSLKQEVFTVDIDPFVKWGLRHQGARHTVADARHLPFSNDSFDSIATETPFEADDDILAEATSEFARLLRPNGHLSIMAAEPQAHIARAQLSAAGLNCTLDTSIDRKGLPVIVLVWIKPPRNS